MTVVLLCNDPSLHSAVSAGSAGTLSGAPKAGEPTTVAVHHSAVSRPPQTGDNVSPMSLWTPDGERPVSAAAPDQTAEPELTPEQEEQARAMAHELAEARARLLETDVATVLANHALGIYELAAIHLTADEPNLPEAQLAIDGLAVLVEGLSGRLGEGEPTLQEALHQARMAFVQRSQPEAGAQT